MEGVIASLILPFNDPATGSPSPFSRENRAIAHQLKAESDANDSDARGWN